MKVIEIKGTDRYLEWMQENDRKVKILRVAGTNLSSNSWTAALGCAIKGERNFMITYEEKN